MAFRTDGRVFSRDFLAPRSKEHPTPRTAALRSSEAKGLQSSVGLIVMATVLSGVLNYSYTLVLTHLLPTRSYSAFSSTLAILLVAGTVANAAVPWVLAQELGRSETEVDERRLFTAGLTLNTLLGLAAAGVGVVLAIGFLSGPSLFALAAGAFGFFVASTGMGWALGHSRYKLLATLVVAEVAVKVVAGIVLVSHGAGVFGAIGGGCIGIDGSHSHNRLSYWSRSPPHSTWEALH